MPVTLRNADILFNDGTTQLRSAHPALTAGSTLFGTGSGTTTSTSYVVGPIGVALAAGTFRVRFRVTGNSQYIPGDAYTPGQSGSTIGEARIFINGVGVGTVVTSPSAGTSAVSQQDFTVNPGDLIQFGVRRVSSSGTLVPTATGEAQYGCGSYQQLPSVRIGVGGSFTI